MIQLSVTIIAFNEEENIRECISSVSGIADEVLIVDSNSADRTEEIAKEMGARVVQHPFESYVYQKNFATDNAKYDYIFSIDADERPSKELIESIKEIKKDWKCPGYSMSRKNFYGDQWIRYGGWYPDIKVRIFKKNKARWAGKILHEYIVMNSGERVCHLYGDLLHYTYKSKSDHIARARKYARLGAEVKKDKSSISLMLKLVFSPTFRFLNTFIFRYGFLDGYRGFLISYISAKETWWKYSMALKLKSQA